MNNNTTNKKKLGLKKTAIANLTLNEAQMKAVVGGGMASGDRICETFGISVDSCNNVDAETHCTGDTAKNTK